MGWGGAGYFPTEQGLPYPQTLHAPPLSTHDGPMASLEGMHWKKPYHDALMTAGGGGSSAD